MIRWNEKTDILFVGDREPSYWQPIGQGFDLGTVASMSLEQARKAVALRMHEATRETIPDIQFPSDTHRAETDRFFKELREEHARIHAKTGGEDPAVKTERLKSERIPTRVPRLSLQEAGDRLAQTVQDAFYGQTTHIMAKTRAAGFEDPRDWVEHALQVYGRAYR